MIHLGDAEGYEDYIAELAGCPLDIVAGNNDFFSELPKEKEIEIGGLKALITHGHYYYVSAGLEDIKKEARGRGMDIVCLLYTSKLRHIDGFRTRYEKNGGEMNMELQENMNFYNM